jgi:methylated-DNA-[protein]-cysteine S-methyltransferase
MEMSAQGYALFETPIGSCGIAWGERGVIGIQLPEGREPETRARVARRFPAAREAPPPPEVRQAVGDIIRLLRGEAVDLSGVPLDMTAVPPFHQQVYRAARRIPPGKTLSYGEIADRAGRPGAARAVGQALGRNPFALVVPCHRVLAAGGRVGGFSATGGITTKLRLLAIEDRGREAAFDGDGAFAFDPAEALDHLRGSDRALARLIDQVGPFAMRLDRAASIFAALAEAIVYQQLTGKAAATIYARLRALFPEARRGPTAAQILRAPDERLRAAGLSRNKVLSLRDLARREADGQLPTLAEVQAMDDEAAIERLTEVRGIGRWTVEMLLMFRLGRPDVLPVDDYGVRKGFAAAFARRQLPSREEVSLRGARWKPYRTVASWYLWRAAERVRQA